MSSIPGPESPSERYRASAERAAEAKTYLGGFIRSLAFELDDFQREACLSLQAGRGVLVAAPTGAGKTIVGEFAIYLALQRGLKAFYTTPIKALSNQKYSELADKYGADRVGLLTGDTSINGDAPVVVMTTEVLRNMLYADSSTLDDLGFVVMDEVHYLADRFRGAVWEEVIIHLPSEVQVASLSATVSNAEEFGAWLDTVRGETDVIVSEHRPVPLWQHVMVGRKIVDLFAGDTTFDEIAPAARGRAGSAVSATAATADLADRPRLRGQPRAAVHGPRREPDELPRTLRPRRPQPAAPAEPARRRTAGRPAQPGPEGQPPPGDRQPGPAGPAAGHHLHLFPRRLRRRRGAVRRRRAVADHREGAAHHCPARRRGRAGHPLRRPGRPRLLELARRAAPRAWRPTTPACCPPSRRSWRSSSSTGLVKAVFATETLALGVNMPARSVVLEKLDKFNGEAHVNITAGEYTQLTGRAGRRGIDVEGHAVVLWQPGTDPAAVAGLASRRTYPLNSSFRPTYNM